MNIILDDTQRDLLAEEIDKIARNCPEMFARKIKRANVQQAFIHKQVLEHVKKDSKILCVGSYEDTACESMKKEGIVLDEIDPLINMDLSTFRNRTEKKYDIIFSTSVIEHVYNDEKFIEDICFLLKEGGVAFLTCDFLDSYKLGDRLPTTCVRFYTKKDLLERFNLILNKHNCQIYGKTDYSSNPDFFWENCQYSFATFCFKKGE